MLADLCGSIQTCLKFSHFPVQYPDYLSADVVHRNSRGMESSTRATKWWPTSQTVLSLRSGSGQWREAEQSEALYRNMTPEGFVRPRYDLLCAWLSRYEVMSRSGRA